MGGTTSKDGKKWNAPAKRIRLEGAVVIRSADGSETEVAKVSLWRPRRASTTIRT